MTGPAGPNVGRQGVTLFHLPFAWAIAAFFALSALAHFTVAGPRWDSYKAQLLKRHNPYRWLEYSLSASIMIVLIAMLVGINDIAALLALVGVNASMIGFGWMQERYETPGAGLGPFWIGCVAGIVRGSPSRYIWPGPAPTSTRRIRVLDLLLALRLLRTVSPSTSCCSTRGSASGATIWWARGPTSHCP